MSTVHLWMQRWPSRGPCHAGWTAHLAEEDVFDFLQAYKGRAAAARDPQIDQLTTPLHRTSWPYRVTADSSSQIVEDLMQDLLEDEPRWGAWCLHPPGNCGSDIGENG